jgi:hypothetical protein
VTAFFTDFDDVLEIKEQFVDADIAPREQDEVMGMGSGR